MIALIVLFIMKTQNYSNHIRYYFPHHFIFLPLIFIMMIWGLVHVFIYEANKTEWLLFSLISFCILYLTLMVRQHYALGNQDRIVRLEFRLRYFELFGKSSVQIENKLSFDQIAALRFADDIEFKSLLELALKDHLKGDEIKKRIKNWQADYMRL